MYFNNILFKFLFLQYPEEKISEQVTTIEKLLSTLKIGKSEQEVKLREKALDLLNSMAPSLHTELYGHKYVLTTLIKDLLTGKRICYVNFRCGDKKVYVC